MSSASALERSAKRETSSTVYSQHSEDIPESATWILEVAECITDSCKSFVKTDCRPTVMCTRNVFAKRTHSTDWEKIRDLLLNREHLLAVSSESVEIYSISQTWVE